MCEIKKVFKSCHGMQQPSSNAVIGCNNFASNMFDFAEKKFARVEKNFCRQKPFAFLLQT